MKRLLTVLALVFGCAAALAAQPNTDDEDVQSWNDVQLTVPLNRVFDFYTALTMRFGKNVSRLNDGRFAVGVAWKPTKALSIMPFYWNLRARSQSGRFRQEHRLNLRLTYRFPVKKFGLIHRSGYEYRKRPPADTWRYRSMLIFEKDLPKKLIPAAKLFCVDEVFYDSGTKRFSRNRFGIGVAKTLTKNLGVDVYYMRQNDGYAHPGDLNALWTTWRVKF